MMLLIFRKEITELFKDCFTDSSIKLSRKLKTLKTFFSKLDIFIIPAKLFKVLIPRESISYFETNDSPPTYFLILALFFPS